MLIGTAARAQPAQPQANASQPIAIVPLDLDHPDQGPRVNGTVQVADGKAIVTSSAEVTSGPETTQIELPRRGVLRVCASTTIHLASDTSVPAGETPGLLMALDHGAVEADFATGRNADILLTPDFRILIGGTGIAGTGAVDVKVRLGEHGDTCIDNPGVPGDGSSSQGLNPGAEAPYVLVSSVFDGGAYRVQPGQRVLFEHGSLHEVNDNEKEPCGCPPASPDPAQPNAFPLAQSQGMAPLPNPAPPPAVPAGPQTESTPPLVFSAPNQPPAQAPQPAGGSQAPTPAPPSTAKKKQGFFHRIGGFFRRIFGAE